MYVDLVEERVGFGAHVRVSCSNGSEHWQLMVEGGLAGRVDAAGRFHHTEYDPMEAGEMPPSTARTTVEDVEESIVYGVPALFIEIKGRVFSSSVVGWIRFWEGPQRTPGSLHSKCGTGSPVGKWVRFEVHKVRGPVQPHGHWPPRRADPALVGSAPVARAEGIVPVEGGWVATTSAGLPVSFEVKGSDVLNAHFGFKWGFCGSYESHLANVDPIDADGHWSFLDTRGQTIEATFVAPDRAEGTVVAVERELPGCPHTRATFVAEPGEVPFQPQVFAVQNANTGHVARRPSEIVLGGRGSLSFHGLKWRGFGGRTAYAVGKAEIRRGSRKWNPRASVWLSSLIEDGPGKQVYSRIRYVLHGPVPGGFSRHGSRAVA
jgi:hypothetical protein